MTKKKNLRDLLYYLKRKYLAEDEYYEENDKECKEKLYDMVTDNVKFFTNNFRCNLNDVIFSISIYDFEKHKPSEIYELAKRFNESATGLYGLEYDNQTHLFVTDQYGNPFSCLAMGPSGYLTNCYEFYFYNPNGQGELYKFSESVETDKFSKEHLTEVRKLKKYQDNYYAELKRDRDRYEEIKKYKDYISVKYIKSGYAHCITEVTVKNDIPIELTTDEIAKYADNWNYCFGGQISMIDKDDEKTVYRVKIYTD